MDSGIETQAQRGASPRSRRETFGPDDETLLELELPAGFQLISPYREPLFVFLAVA